MPKRRTRVRAKPRAPARRRAAKAASNPRQPLAPAKRKGTPRAVPAHRTYTPELTEHIRYRLEETAEPVKDMAADLGIHPSSLHRLAKRLGWVRRNLPPPRDLSPALRLFEAARAETARVLGEGLARAGEPSEQPARALDDGRAGSSLRSPPLGGAASGERERAERGEREPPDIGERESTAVAATAPPELSTLERLERAVVAELATVEAMRARYGPEPEKPRDAERTVRTLGLLTQTLQQLLRLRIAAAGAPQSVSGQSPYDDDMPADIDKFRLDFARRIREFVKSRTGDGGAQPSAAAAAVDSQQP